MRTIAAYILAIIIGMALFGPFGGLIALLVTIYVLDRKSPDKNL